LRSAPELAARDGIESRRGLVEKEQLRLPTSAQAMRALLLTPDSPPTRECASRKLDLIYHLADIAASR